MRLLKSACAAGKPGAFGQGHGGVCGGVFARQIRDDQRRFFAGYGRRIMPASAGRTTMCPTEMGYDADVPPCLRLLPIETRLQPQALMEWRMAPEKWTRIDLDVKNPQQLARRWKKSLKPAR
jgi:hypothetical protein